MKSILILTFLSLIGTSLGIFQPILSSFLSKQMNAARYGLKMPKFYQKLMLSGAIRTSIMSRSSWRWRKTKWISFLNSFLDFSLGHRCFNHDNHIFPQLSLVSFIVLYLFRKVPALSTMSFWGRLTPTLSTWLRTGSQRRTSMRTPRGTMWWASSLRWAPCGGRWSSARTRQSQWQSKVWRLFPLYNHNVKISLYPKNKLTLNLIWHINEKALHSCELLIQRWSRTLKRNLLMLMYSKQVILSWPIWCLKSQYQGTFYPARN